MVLLNVVIPEIDTFPPTFKLLPIPTPPVITSAPVVVSTDCVVVENDTF